MLSETVIGTMKFFASRTAFWFYLGMHKFIALLIGLLLTTATGTFAAPSEPIVLWPKGAPGETGDIGPEQDMTKPKDGQVDGRRVMRIGNVSNPTLTVYPPPADKNTGAAVIVCPGGGYNILAWDLEGTEVCDWLNSIGVTGVLLKYRVPARKGQARHAAPLQDAQRALGIVRQRAAEWKLDPKRIGILGFSAGGHLAAVASNNYDQRTYEPVDDADKLGCRADFAVLVYPAYLTQKDQGDKLSPELPVTANTPPTFIVQTQDDKIRVETSLFYYHGLCQAKVPAELHLFPTGGHGYGLRPSPNAVSTWPKLVADWMRGLGVLSER